MKPKTFSRSEKKLLLISVMAVSMIAVVAMGRHWADTVPPLQISQRKTPSPNGYDLYLRASKSFVPAVPPVDPSQDSRKLPESRWAQAYPTAAKQAWLVQNREALSALRRGLQMESVPPRHHSYEADQMSRGRRFREMARMLVVESRVHGERGDWGSAAESAIDTVAFGHGLKRGARLDFLLGSAVAALGRRRLGEIMPQLSALQARRAAVRLEKLYQSRATYTQVLQEDKHFHHIALREKMLSDEWHEWHREGYKGFDGKVDLQQRWELWKAPRRVIMHKLVSHVDQLIADSSQPYSQLREDPLEPGEKFVQRPPHRESGDALVDSLETGSHRWSHERENAANALQLVSLALHAFHGENSRYPARLEELVPEYLNDVPADPFGAGGALQYSLRDETYLLYSLGPDAVDDKGEAIEDESKSKSDRLRYRVEELSMGDFVAGINH